MLPSILLSLALALLSTTYSIAVPHREPEKGVAVRLLTELDPHEPYEAHAFHSGHLWVGRNRKNGIFYQVEAYLPDGSRLAGAVSLEHTVGYLYPFGPTNVLAVGKKYTDSSGWRTYYSVIQFRGSRLTAKTTQLPVEIQTEQFAGHPGALYFNQVGDRAIFQQTGKGPRFLKATVSGPGKMVLLGNTLFLIERQSVYPGDEHLTKIDLRTETALRTFSSVRDNLVNLIELKGYGKVAAAEVWADQVLLVDVEKNTLTHTLSVPGGPGGMAQVGHCLLVLGYSSKNLHFFDLRASVPQEAAVWDLSAMGQDYQNVRNLAADPATGRAYIRIPFRPQLPGAKTGVFIAEQTSGETYRRCTSP